MDEGVSAVGAILDAGVKAATEWASRLAPECCQLTANAPAVATGNVLPAAEELSGDTS